MIATDEELYAICNIAKRFKEDLPELEKDALKIMLDIWINKLVQRQIDLEKEFLCMTFREDKTYCASPNCTNECGRKIPDDIKAQFLHVINDYAWVNCVSYGYFCGIPELEHSEEPV